MPQRTSVIGFHKETNALLGEKFKCPLIKGYEPIFTSAFVHSILPRPTKQTFTFNETHAPLYVKLRSIPMEAKTATDIHERLHSVFWNTVNHKRVLALLGTVGSGKSTLIDYYLRCYCPNDAKLAERFKEKLIIWIDCDGIEEKEEFTAKFWKRVYDAAKYAAELYTLPIPFSDIEDANKSFQLRADATLKAINKMLHDGKSGDFRFRYIVMVVDNLDRSPLNVQKLAIDTVRDWIEPSSEIQGGIELWQVYLPLWPSTLDSLARCDGITIKKEDLHIESVPPLDPKVLLESRIRELKKEVQRTKVKFGADEFSRDEVCREVEQVEQLLNRDIFEPVDGPGRSVVEFTSSLMGGNMRKSINLWEGIFTSKTVYSHLARRVKLRRYEIEDALIVGNYPVYHPEKSPIMNVFDCTRGSGSDGDILIGFHALHVLRPERLTDDKAFLRDMASLGYHESKCESILNEFLSANLIHLVFNLLGFRGILTHPGVFEGYLQLLTRPAYLDNMAMLTPIDESLIKGEDLKRSVGFDRHQFHLRAKCTTSFIGFIQQEEERFLADLKRKDEAVIAGFKEVTERKRIPKLSSLLASNYHERLQFLRNGKHLEAAAEINNTWWDNILSRPIFKILTSEEIPLARGL